MSALEAARRIVETCDEALRPEPDGWVPASETFQHRRYLRSAALLSHGEFVARAYIKACEALEDAARKIEARSELYTSEDQMCRAIIDHCRTALSCPAPQVSSGGSMEKES